METAKKKNRWLSFFVDGVLSGLMIGTGGIVSLSCDNRYLGAFLFSLGLFCIVQFRYGLYTGKAGRKVLTTTGFFAILYKVYFGDVSKRS